MSKALHFWTPGRRGPVKSCLSMWISVCRSVTGFLGICSLVFSEIQDWQKSRHRKKWEKRGYSTKILVFSDLAMLCFHLETLYPRKSRFASYKPKCSHPIRLQDSLNINTSWRNVSMSLILCMEIFTKEM